MIDGATNGKGNLPTLDMTIVDVSARHQKMNVHAIGDAKGGKSSGPASSEKRNNLSGYYAFGGKAGNHGIDLGLVRS